MQTGALFLSCLHSKGGSMTNVPLKFTERLGVLFGSLLIIFVHDGQWVHARIIVELMVLVYS